MMNELYVNGSGCKDPTGGKAMENVMNEAKDPRSKYEDGDIVEVYTPKGNVYMLILKCHSEYATTLKLLDEPPYENDIPVRVKNMMFADTGKTAYVYYDKINTYIRSLSAAEYFEVQKYVAEAFGFDVHPETGICKIPQLKEVREIDYDGIADRIYEKMRTSQNLRNDLIRTEAERDVYKDLYIGLLEKGTGR